MSRNLVFLIDIKKDGKTKKEYQMSIDSWSHFCKKLGFLNFLGLK